jgi:hypothetical protein
MFFQVYNWKTSMTLKKTNKKKLMDVWILQQKWSCPLLVKSPKKKTNIEQKSKRPPSEDTNSEIRSSMTCFCGIIISQQVRRAFF